MSYVIGSSLIYGQTGAGYFETTEEKPYGFYRDTEKNQKATG